MSRLTIPFEFAGTAPIFTVMAEGESKQFILDTGSPYMVLNSRYEAGDTTGTNQVQTKFLHGFEWGGLRFNNQMAMLTDLSHLERYIGKAIHGLIGCAQLADYDLLLDYCNRQITLVDSYGEIPEFMSGAKHIPFTMSQHIPVIPVAIGKKNFSLGLDTGAEWNVLSKEHKGFCYTSGIASDTVYDTVLRADVNDSEEGVCICSIKNIVIGDAVTVDSMRFCFHDIGIPQIKADGLMGYELFKRHTALIRFAKRELIIKIS